MTLNITRETVDELRDRVRRGESCRAVAKDLGLNRSTAANILKGRFRLREPQPEPLFTAPAKRCPQCGSLVSPVDVGGKVVPCLECWIEGQ